ncbi:MAG: hypothetical protein K6C99_08780 [Lachnospiraceae bacterium]|nr:hypothetical protein [Lachnospiraceae bacterium]
MTQEKKEKKPRIFLIFILIALTCIALYFTVSIIIKRVILYSDCSKIEEYRTHEIVKNAEDYDFDVSKLIFMMDVSFYGKEENYHLYIFEDGKIFTGDIQTRNHLWEHNQALEKLNADVVIKNVDMTYFGTMSGKELYKIKSLMGEIDFSADSYDYIIEYYRKYEGVEDPRNPSDFKTFEVDPWINAECYENGAVNHFYTQAADGIRYYLYDRHANRMINYIEDSWYFDQWMSDIYGDDWRREVTIYISEEDIVLP